MPIPNDPIILLSFVNTKLRDQYSSLGELCGSLRVREEDIVDKLKSVGFEYSEEQNRFM